MTDVSVSSWMPCWCYFKEHQYVSIQSSKDVDGASSIHERHLRNHNNQSSVFALTIAQNKKLQQFKYQSKKRVLAAWNNHRELVCLVSQETEALMHT